LLSTHFDFKDGFDDGLRVEVTGDCTIGVAVGMFAGLSVDLTVGIPEVTTVGFFVKGMLLGPAVGFCVRGMLLGFAAGLFAGGIL
jgi:hypothetical protein